MEVLNLATKEKQDEIFNKVENVQNSIMNIDSNAWLKEIGSMSGENTGVVISATGKGRGLVIYRTANKDDINEMQRATIKLTVDGKVLFNGKPVPTNSSIPANTVYVYIQDDYWERCDGDYKNLNTGFYIPFESQFLLEVLSGHAYASMTKGVVFLK